MDLNLYTVFSKIDRQDMLSHIDGLPDQLATAWETGKQKPLPDWQGIERVLVTGMGGSAIGADLLAAYNEKSCRVPFFVQRDYELPGWAQDSSTLVIASSHSGGTEETLSAFQQATQRGCRRLALSTGGELERMANDSGAILWKFEHHGQPQAAMGYSFGLLLAAFARLGLIPDPEAELWNAVEAMRSQQVELQANIPVAQNRAKRLAGQLVGRWVAVMGSGLLAPVARRWKSQISELAKAWAQFEFIPEANHNTLAGCLYPDLALSRTVVLFLRSPHDHPRNQRRIQLTQQSMMLNGLGTDIVDARGDTPLANLWTMLHFGDYTAYYLAMCYEVDPTPAEVLQQLRQQLAMNA